MQRDRESDRQLFAPQLLDARDQSACGDDDAPRADAQQVGAGEVAHRLDDRLIVGHRFAHAHKYNMRQTPTLACEQADSVHRLLHYLVSFEVAAEWKLAGRAERTSNGAAGLRGDAQRRAVRVAHDDGLDRVAAIELVERFRGQPTIGLRRRDGPEGREAELAIEGCTQGLWDVVHLLERRGPARDPTRQLAPSVRGRAIRDQPRLEVSRGQRKDGRFGFGHALTIPAQGLADSRTGTPPRLNPLGSPAIAREAAISVTG